MKQRVRTCILLLATVLALAFLFAGCGGNEKKLQEVSSNTYTVTFNLNGGTLTSGELEQKVQEGGSARAPQAENGSMRLSWDRDFSNVTSDITVNAQWEKVELSSTEVAEIVQKSTVTINCDFYNGASGSGSGFFIDSDGTIVTCYHVIEYASDITVEVYGGGKYDVESVVAFSELHDLAIIKIKMTDAPALPISEESVKVGETVYANGSALGLLQGTFTSGTVSNISRDVNGISCIQMDAAISSGNSGGPLVNAACEVVGVNAMSYINGENLNLAIKVENLDNLTNEVNYTVNDYLEWIMRETDRSYSIYDDYGDFYYSTLNTYQYVTGRACEYSVDFDDYYVYGYMDSYYYYVYEFHESEADAYVEYLKTKGFVFSYREEYSGGVSYFYVNEWSGVWIDMYQDIDGYLSIWVYK